MDAGSGEEDDSTREGARPSAGRPLRGPEGVRYTHLDEELFDGAGVEKRCLIEYLDLVADRILPVLAGRALSVVRVHRGSEAFMQKNLPSYAPDWIETVRVWARASRREVAYPICADRRTLLWFANQRAVEYHPALELAAAPGQMTHLVLDLDPPEGAPFSDVVRVALAARAVLDAAGLAGAVKTSGSKGLHVFVPVAAGTSLAVATAATRALAARVAALEPRLATTEFVRADRAGRVFVDATRAGGATVVATYSPRVRPGVTLSWPLRWNELEDGSVDPAELRIGRAAALLDSAGGEDLWAASMPPPQHVPAALVGEGDSIPVPRVAAMRDALRRRRGGRTGPQ